MRVGERVKEIIREDGLTMTAVAGRLGISRQALYKRLDGNMGVEQFFRLMEELGHEVRYVRDGVAKRF